jgi:hypothetical protein
MCHREKWCTHFGFLKALATGERLKLEGRSQGAVEVPSGKARAAVIAGTEAARKE